MSLNYPYLPLFTLISSYLPLYTLKSPYLVYVI